ncbi:unnamed protein product [Meloidogyne enterolobii]|uniref:Uncharacterized protein n=1 Tax=Meloidogyne enterolobii TaxID=390850 RepID=A0ACB0ZK09_MELEN
MCNRKLDFPLDERGWQINEKIEVGNVGRRSDALIKKEKGGSVWIDLFTFSGVPMVSASTITSKNNEKKVIEKEEEEDEIINEQKRKKNKRRTNKLDDDEEIREGSVHEDENEEQEKVNSKKRQRRRRKYDREVKEENEENIDEGNDEESYEKVEGGEQDNEIEKGTNNDEEIEEEKEEEVTKEEKENDGEEVDEENEEEGDEGKDEGDEEDKDETGDEEDNEGNVGEDRKENEEDEDDNNDKDDNEEFDSTLSIADKKRMCRYRLSCYADKGIKIPGKYGGKEQKQENGEYIPSGKRTLGGTKLKIVDVEKKATLKDAAKLAVKKVRQQEAEGEVLREKYVYDGERVLADFWAELERKNRCKYRRSCYLSGKLPKIKQSEILQWLGSFGSSGFWKGEREEENDEEKRDEEEVKFENLNEYERKLFCRYRNSCYKNGIKPKINNNSITTFGIKEWNFNNLIKDLKEWWGVGMEGKQEIDKEEGKQTKLECKYRKSCYSSGKLPEELRIDKNEEKQTITKILEGKKVPTSVKELKLFCKYRKSCYVANAAIQQTEIIEKEKQNKNITVEEKKLIIKKSMKNSSPPKEEKKNKKLPKNSSKRKIKIEEVKEDEEENKKEKIKKDCFVDKKRIKETISPQEGCKFIERRKEEENLEGNLEEENEEVKKRKMKKYIVNEEINEIKEEEREVEEEGEVEEEKKVEDEEEEELKKEEEEGEEEKETKNKIRKNKKYNIEAKENLVEEKKQWKRRKSLNEDKPLFDWRILSNLLLTGSKEPREFEIEEWEKMSEKERLFRCRQVLKLLIFFKF